MRYPSVAEGHCGHAEGRPLLTKPLVWAEEEVRSSGLGTALCPRNYPHLVLRRYMQLLFDNTADLMEVRKHLRPIAQVHEALATPLPRI